MKKNFAGLALAAVALTTAPSLLTPSAFAQAISVNGGSIGGTITDPSGAVVSNATVTIVGVGTGFKRELTTDKAGFYTVGPLNPGTYTVTVAAPGFQTLSVNTPIRTGTVTQGSYKLSLGQSTTEISVTAGDVQVNTDQIAVADVITKEQISTLPINGRNFLDLAQIEPGVVLQSGESFDPTKAGYSAISVSGVSGRTTRILLDGQDITDENVGTTIFNVSQGAIGEFQLNRSTQDVSGEVTSTGQVLVSTNSGTNALHGQLFYNFQDARALFAKNLGLQIPFQRNQFGGSVGGPIIKDKLFFFGNAERIKQDSSSATPVNQGAGAPFTAIAQRFPTIPSPYRETYSTVRLDYNGPKGSHFFVRANYNVNAVAGNYGFAYSLYSTRNNTPGLAGGADFAFGRTTHSFRGSYEKFHNVMGDVTGSSSSLYNPLPGYTLYNAAQSLFTGPNYLANQGTFQSDKQFRYDGSWTKGAHTVRFGYSLNRILGGGYAAFWGLSPMSTFGTGQLLSGVVSTANPFGYGCRNVVGAAACPTDPINGYRTSTLYLGNGLGSFTEKPNFGLPGGGTYDWRSGAYLSDNWKITPNFTLTAGVRWSVDTQRANQDLPQLNCSSVNTSTVAAPCTGSTSLLAQWNPTLAGSVHQPWANFGPQLGFVYAPGDHKTALRGGIGMYYEGDVFNNTTNARSSLLASGPFFADQTLCSGGGTFSLVLPNGTSVSSVNGTSIRQLCYSSIGSASTSFIQLQNQYKTASAASPNVQNTSFVGNNLTVDGVYGAPYRTPYSIQWNFGIQREVFKGAVLSADYVHNSTIHISQYVDQNHVGAARFLNATAARNAIAGTATQYGCATTGSAQAQVQCAISAGATLQDFSNNGLDSGEQILGGNPASYVNNGSLTPNTGAAFAGQNGALGHGNFLLPIGRSGYDALQVVFRQNASHPAPGIESANVQLSYNLSRIVSSSGGGSDQFFSSGSWDNDDPNRFMGRNGLDRKHQVNFGTTVTLKYGPRVGLIGHFYSAPPTTLTLDNSNPVGGIFTTDITGDGTVGDIAPGTQVGDYMHRIKGSNLGSYITNFNNTYAGTLTPAGQALVNAGLFTTSQLRAIGANIQPIAQLQQANAITNPMFRSFDASFSYPIRFNRLHEGMSLEPAIVFYNVGNLANYSSQAGSGVLLNTSTAGGTRNTDSAYLTGASNFYDVYNSNRTQRGSGTFSVGAPRSTEFQLKLNF